MRHEVFLIATLALTLCFAGCGGANSSSGGENQATESGDNLAQEGVVKIAVTTDGNVFVNSEAVSIDSLSSKLDTLGEIKEIWYYREAPNAAEPHENAMKVIKEIAKRKLPIAMYLDREFRQPATFGG